MKESNPNRKVGLVTFTDNVCIIGDASAAPLTLGMEYMNDYNLLLKNGIACAHTSLSKSLSESHELLKQKVN